MNINEAIKQSKFKSEYQKLTINILYTHSWLNGLHNHIMKEYDLSVQQYNVLRILRGQKGKSISVNDITSRMIDKMSNSSRLVDKLQKKGWAERSTCEKDRRQVDVKITEKGLALLEQLDKKLDGMDEMLTGLNKEEAKQLNDLLDKLRNK